MKYLVPASGIFAFAFLAFSQTPPPAQAPKPIPGIPQPPSAVKPAGAAEAPLTPDSVVITVGDQKITKAQFDAIISTLPDAQRAAIMAPGQKRRLAESFAELETLAQEGRARKIDQSAKVKEQIRIQSEQIIAQNTFAEIASQSAKTPDAAAIQAYYDSHKADWEQVHARHILIRFAGTNPGVPMTPTTRTEADAFAKINELHAKIVAGAKFAELAKTESEDTGTAPQGGDLSSFGKGVMTPPFEQAAFAAKIGQVTDPVRTQFGYHLILVESHETKTLEQSKPEIEAKLKPQMQQEAAQAALAALKAKKNITYNDSYFGN